MSESRVFDDRYDAGRQLAHALLNYAHRTDLLVLGLPRGGIPVAYEVALCLNAPLDVCVVRKLGAPEQEEMAIGAIGMGGTRVLNRSMVERLNIARHVIDEIEARERRELQRRNALYRDDEPMPQLESKAVILVDDGLATGATMRAAIQTIKQDAPAQIVVAVPTASRETCAALNKMPEVDDMVCLLTPRHFRAVGLWYRNFEQTQDEEVSHLLKEARYRENINS